MALQWAEEDVRRPDQLDREGDLKEELDDVGDECDGRPHDKLDEPYLEVNQVIWIDIVVN